ncbi:DUF695 domain-containing protein [Porphyromonas pogonae]|uniref:DUF695 domain-containing protein n=1 Tax=Porphyromonas pogonae TaxID=867595 RepID=UPI002E7999F9|nr:DUF695 domain-containing protein [Porphyromonas pogonae]
MKLSDNWFTAISQTDDGQQLVFVTGRKDLDEFRKSGKLPFKIEIKWLYESDKEGMPTENDAELINEVEMVLRKMMEKDKLAILTGNYTGGGAKFWIFYARNLNVFGERLNSALMPYDLLPLEIQCEEDHEWDEYLDMISMSENAIEED